MEAASYSVSMAMEQASKVFYLLIFKFDCV